ncbi:MULTISPECIES: flagellar hook protein FlgE [unclassified Aureimonas]|uniref:flagellar hook protein FlgE n=1 Tax=unclassified Aureimonas TaxID=2615206 RepID=UPI0006F93BBD|nr:MULTISPECIES: flagellar hook protein FlgE [unclassified Aureimonas]KQT66084.1 hypothetical protein ASG62_19935 [Aureimonas sp. Leaf427]KQT81052.1 hypothetical protein ASG54_06315 [Aureimonas sp. Leaf460]
MSIGGIMRTSVSGMNAQATRLSTVSENIANSDTTGYKQSQTEFSSLVLANSGAGYNSGAVQAQVRTLVSQQGGLSYTGNDNSPKKLDFAVEGQGFFAVADGSGGTYLTRAGSFTQMADGTLVNAAGYKLQGYPVTSNGTDNVLNGFAGLKDVNLKTSLLSANPTTEGLLTVPLDKKMTAQSGTHATFTPAVPYKATAGSGSPNTYIPVANDYLTFSVSIDGAAAVPVEVKPPAGKFITDITVYDIRNAINAEPSLKNSASVSADGKLVLSSPSDKLGTTSTISMTAPVQMRAATTTAIAANDSASLAGLGVITPAVAGIPATFPSQNTALLPVANSTISTSLTVYNNSGEAVKLDIYYTKVSDTQNTWEVAVFDSRKATPNTGSSPFPYGASGEAPLATATLDFSEDSFKLQTISAGAGATQTDNKILNIDLGPIGGQVFKLDIGDTTQFTGKTQPLAARVNGNPAEVIKNIAVGVDGTITASFASGTTRTLFKVPLAMVNSPDSMQALPGNVYAAGIESGTVLMGFGGSGGFGNLTAGALEESTVDLANELTTMIESQRSYTANSKVFQTGSEILDVLVNLKR